MKRILDKSNMTEADWQEYRKSQKGIGGSEAAIILGMNPYKSAFRLWLEKTGQVEPDKVDNEYVEWGTALEPVIRQKFQEKTGFEVYENPFVLQHDTYDFMIANIDGEVIDSRFGGKPGILEIKTAGERQKKDWEDGCPNHYMIQIQHYLAVTEYEYAYVAVLIGGNHFKYYVINRDDYVIDKLITAEMEFQEMVEKQIPPEISGNDSDSEYLAATFPEDNGEEVSFISPQIEDLALEYHYIQKEIKALQGQAEALKNRIKLEAKENKVLKGYRVKISMPTINKVIFDSKTFASENPEMYKIYKTKESSYRSFTVSVMEE